jgi:hypothetical protein
MDSIRNYVSAAAEWCQAMGCPDPRKIEPWIYDRFKREAPKFLEVFQGTKAKLSMRRQGQPGRRPRRPTSHSQPAASSQAGTHTQHTQLACRNYRCLKASVLLSVNETW